MNEIQIKQNNSLDITKPFKIVSDFNPSGDQPDAINSRTNPNRKNRYFSMIFLSFFNFID